MFTISYKLQDGGPLYECTYPQKENCDHNIFFIRGTNDQGKTTSLNMVALGLYANEGFSKDKGTIISDSLGTTISDSSGTTISDSLRAKMDYLMSNHLDHLEFDFEIKSMDSRTSIHSRYSNNNLRTELNGEIAGSEYFNENIQVLYDIPDDPLVKLQSSVRLIRENLLDYEIYLQRYYRDIGQKLTQIEDFKKKDLKIKENKASLENTRKELDLKNKTKERVEEELLKLEIVENVFLFHDICDLMDQNEVELKNLKDKRTKLKQKGLGGGTPKFQQQVREFNLANGNVKSSLAIVKRYLEVLSEEQTSFFIKVGKKLNGLYKPQSIDTITIEKWMDTIPGIISQLEEDPIHKQFQDEEKQYELVSKIMGVLSEYLSLEMNIPGTNVNNIFSFYRELEEFIKKIEPKISRKKDLSKVIRELKTLNNYLSDLKVKRELLPDVDEKQMYDYSQIEKDITQLESKLSDLYIQASKYKERINSLPENDIIEILKYPGKREQYQRTKKEFEGLCEEIEALEQKENTLKILIRELGVVKTPTAHDEKWLQEELYNCENLIPKILKWKKALEPVNFRMTNIGVNYDQAKEFFDSLSEYFAEILQIVYFEKKSWEVEKVDLVNKQYIVKTRKPIKFIQMGAGHTALNSILARIKQKFGGRKKIVLVDEIGHMDEGNIRILVEEIKNQIKNGETILALITIADSTVSEITWEPVSL
jgi:hypothetical protein